MPEIVIDTSKISLTTVQGYLSAVMGCCLAMAPVWMVNWHPKIGSAFALIGGLIAACKEPISQSQHDATKPTDSAGNPLPSSEVPVAK